MFGRTALAFFALMLAEGSVMAEATKAPEGDTGIASKYVGDVGIGNDPAVIYATSFEDGITGGLKQRRTGVTVLRDPKIARTGTGCAQITATRGKDTGGDLKYKWSPGVDQCFVRVYVKFHKDTVTPHHFVNMGGSTPTFKYRFGGGAGFRPPGGVNGHWGTTIEPHPMAAGMRITATTSVPTSSGPSSDARSGYVSSSWGR